MTDKSLDITLDTCLLPFMKYVYYSRKLNDMYDYCEWGFSINIAINHHSIHETHTAQEVVFYNYNKAIPDGHKIGFIDGNPRNITIENLYVLCRKPDDPITRQDWEFFKPQPIKECKCECECNGNYKTVTIDGRYFGNLRDYIYFQYKFIYNDTKEKRIHSNTWPSINTYIELMENKTTSTYDTSLDITLDKCLIPYLKYTTYNGRLESITDYCHWGISVCHPLLEDDKLKSYLSAEEFVFITKFGRIPAGYEVAFIDGNKRNITMDNLKLVLSDRPGLFNEPTYYHDTFLQPLFILSGESRISSYCLEFKIKQDSFTIDGRYFSNLRDIIYDVETSELVSNAWPSMKHYIDQFVKKAE